MKNAKKLAALFLALVMCLSMLAGCNNSATQTSDPANTNDVSSSSAPKNDTLVVGQDGMDGKFSPFFYTAVPDEDVVSMINVSLFGVDRAGAIVEKGIEGQKAEYNGTEYTYYGIADLETTETADGGVDYSITLKEGVKFSDGVEMTIDDVIFNMYVFSDPTYDGSTTFFALPIEGMAEYRANMKSLFNLLIAAGKDNTDFEYWTEEQQTAFWADFEQAGVKFVTEIKAYLVGAGYNAETDPVEVWCQNWGFSVPEGATELDLFYVMCEAYGWDINTLSSKETAGSSLFDLMEDYASTYAAGVATGESAANITGIKKTGDYSMTIHMTEVDATAVLNLTLAIAPLHHYGDLEQYDYENNKFGFPKGDLSIVKAKTSDPLGAGPYTFVSYENGVVTLQANPTYWKGEPKIKYLKYQFVSDADKVTGVDAGTLDIASPAFSTDVVEELASINGSEDFDGDVITIKTTQYLGYGYIGLNGKNLSVAGDPGSDASKNLRKGIATILAVYRDVVIDSYYGDYASVINYPISNTSWAAPQVTDEGYKVAFSVDVDGNPIYTDGMSDEEKYAAALEASLGFFEAAGYTVENGKLTAAPEGAKLEYEVIVPGGGTGDHPNFMILTMARDALASIGMTLVVNDVSDGTVTIGNKLDAGTAEMWTMAWSATPDPDMYQIYYSDIANGGANPGGSNNYYYIKDAELDQLILDARKSLDQSYRKVLYKEALDIVVDWACEVPVYQRTDCWLFSTERVNTSTITPDMTPYWGWATEIETLELN